MSKWVVAHEVEYSSASDENIDSFAQKYIAEILRIYDLLHRLRSGDLSTGEPIDTVPWQFHVDGMTNILSIRNPGDTAWIAIGKLNEAKDRFIFDRAVANNGGAPSIQFGTLAERPAAEVNGAVFVSTDEAGGYRYYRFNTTTSAWAHYNVAITKDANGKIIGNLAGNADTATHAQTADQAAEATHATTATSAGYASTSAVAETAARADQLAQSVKINGVPFNGSESINIGITGGAAEEVAAYQSLLWRTAQNEREISNMALYMEAVGYYPDYNNLLPINFVDDSNKLDQAATTVLSSTAGGDTLVLDSLANVRSGRTYTITDGLNQEMVQIKSVAKNGSAYSAILAAALANSYTSGSTKLYRTTTKIADGKAYGADTNKIYGWYPGVTWRGVNASTTVTVECATTTETASQFTITGDVAFTADGYVTLQ